MRESDMYIRYSVGDTREIIQCDYCTHLLYEDEWIESHLDGQCLDTLQEILYVLSDSMNPITPQEALDKIKEMKKNE